MIMNLEEIGVDEKHSYFQFRIGSEIKPSDSIRHGTEPYSESRSQQCLGAKEKK